MPGILQAAVNPWFLPSRSLQFSWKVTDGSNKHCINVKGAREEEMVLCKVIVRGLALVWVYRESFSEEGLFPSDFTPSLLSSRLQCFTATRLQLLSYV